MAVLVEVEQLRKRFGPITAVDDVSFSARRGEVLGFLGPNGAGKSTTMKMVTGFLTPDGGRVDVCGHRLPGAALEAKRRLGYLPEGAPLYGDMTTRSFLDFVAEIRGLRGEPKTRRLDDTIAKVDLESVLDQPIQTLSKGFKRRVGLAQAIVHDPQVLILDEPTDGLDPNQKHEVRKLIREMAAEKVIILSTHILEEVDAVCTRAVIIAHGRIVADGTPEQLEARSRRHNAVTLAVARECADSARDTLAALGSVASVEVVGTDDATVRYRVYPRDRSSIVAELGELARRQAWQVTEMHAERGRLDDVFRAVTTAEEAA